jgi:hypothetical protein
MWTNLWSSVNAQNRIFLYFCFRLFMCPVPLISLDNQEFTVSGTSHICNDIHRCKTIHPSITA